MSEVTKMREPLSKTPEWHAERLKGIGGSDAAKIMSGDWHALWEEKTGRRKPEDLSFVLPVQIGVITEPLNLLWFEHTTGKTVTAAGEMRTHPQHSFMRCTLDGIADDAVVQCKHVNAFAKIEEVAQNYMPQMTHEMACTSLSRAWLSVFIGTLKYEWIEIPLDDFYCCQLIDREREFWSFVERDEPPPSKGAITAPIPQSKWRTIDMSSSNLWATRANEWLTNKRPAARFRDAEKELKAAIEPDVGTARGHGIICTRNKAGSLTIKEL